ncbi:MAG TPA: AraC family transcriptional regulator [Thermoanaerobaculia bacterium]|nr:AraC family transcriptional regulator [Thermoanaerobaculia bacterium]
MGFTFRTLFRSGDYAIADWKCEGRDDENRIEVKDELEIVFVRRGVFVVQGAGGDLPVTPNEVWLYPAGIPYRIHHPRGGDECTVITISPALLEEYSCRVNARDHALASSRSFRIQYQMWSVARDGSPSPLAMDEHLRSILEDVFGHTPVEVCTQRQRVTVLRAREILAARFTENLPLSEIAAAAGSSPYHLCRIFRRMTGETLHRYQTGLRLREALVRLGDGQRDLTALALDLGFFDHSHFAGAFRRAFGRPPSRFRDAAPPDRMAQV